MSALIGRLSGNWLTVLQWLSRGIGRGQTSTNRLCLLGALYTGVLTLSLWLSCELRYGFEVPVGTADWWLRMTPLVVAIKLGFLYGFGQFTGWLTYFSIPELRRLTRAMLSGSLVIALLDWRLGEGGASVPMLIIDLVFSFAGISACRVGLRVLAMQHVAVACGPKRLLRRVGIIGAGDAGAMLARELESNRRAGMAPVAFFDDDRNKWGSRVHEIPVVGGPEMLSDDPSVLELDEVIIAMPSAPARRIKEVVTMLSRSAVKFQTVPSLAQLATGQVEVSHLRKVEIEDLLGREPVALQTDEIRDVLQGKVVLVTGAGGSIGSELCRQIAPFEPKVLLIVERAEGNLYHIEQELTALGFRGKFVPLVADILDQERMEGLFRKHGPQVVFHAAAHKHVPMMESQPGEAIRNNSIGTARLAELSLRTGVERFLMISTDKAINPTNVMGTTKRLGEIFVQSLHEANPGRTKFMAVRFGNVLGSSGSVIPLFKKQIIAGGPVTVTHPEVTRYFMTIPEAVGLVLQTVAQGEGGEIFVLDMGRPVKIADLAQQLIELSGLKPGVDINIEYVGLRPGEKLYEELSYQGENIAETRHPKIMRLVCQAEPISQVRANFLRLEERVSDPSPESLKQLLHQLVPEYRPFRS